MTVFGSKARRAEGRSSRQQTSKRGKTSRRSANPRTPQLVMIVGDQQIINQLEERGGIPTQVWVTGPNNERLDYNNAYTVDMAQARQWCHVCRSRLCNCKDKFEAPFILAWKVRRDGRRAVPLNRQELPIRIRKRQAA